MSDVAPYFVLDPDTVELGPWYYLTSGNDWRPLPEMIEDWDYNTDLHLRRSVGVDTTAALASAELDEGAALKWSLSWRTRDSQLCPTAAVVRAVAGTSQLEALMEGHELGATVDISTRIVLAEERHSDRPGAARRAGSILFAESVRLELMGSMAQFPIAVLDFEAAGLDPDASVVLELPDDPAAPLLGGALLMINARDAALVSAVSSGDRDTDGPAGILRSELAEDVFRSLLDYATDPERAKALDLGDFDDESVGRSVVLLAERAQRYGGLRGLRMLRQAEPTRYVTAVNGEARRQGHGRELG